jgi:3-deoxy-D-manno-octulosonic-acid transferase
MLNIFFSFYNLIFITVYCLTLPFAFFLVKSKILSHDFLEYYGFLPHHHQTRQSIWFHCASVGEIKSITALIKDIKREHSSLNVIITTMTESGKKTAIKEIEGATVFLLPIENALSIRKIIKKNNVKLLFIIETELWPNLINTASKCCKLYLINGRLSQKTYKKYKATSFLFRKLFNKFNGIYAKSMFDKNLIESISYSRVKYLGNIKFASNNINLNKDIIETFYDKNCLLLASTHKGEESFFIKYVSRYIDKFDYIIIAPRHISRIMELQNLLKNKNLAHSVFSKEKTFNKFIIIDVFGLMDTFYYISRKIFIGGSLVNIGGHNIYEALRLKKIVATGPHMNNFKDISELALNCRILYVINNIDDFINYLDICDNNLEQFYPFFRKLDHMNKKSINHLMELIKNEISK